jgi:hypothetical protein
MGLIKKLKRKNFIQEINIQIRIKMIAEMKNR